MREPIVPCKLSARWPILLPWFIFMAGARADPEQGEPARFLARAGSNTVSLRNVAHFVIRHLSLDGQRHNVTDHIDGILCHIPLLMLSIAQAPGEHHV